MKYDDIEVGKKYMITSTKNEIREIDWKEGLLPPPGTIITVREKRNPEFAYPIHVEDEYGKPFHVKPDDIERIEIQKLKERINLLKEALKTWQLDY